MGWILRSALIQYPRSQQRCVIVLLMLIGREGGFKQFTIESEYAYSRHDIQNHLERNVTPD